MDEERQMLLEEAVEVVLQDAPPDMETAHIRDLVAGMPMVCGLANYDERSYVDLLIAQKRG